MPQGEGLRLRAEGPDSRHSRQSDPQAGLGERFKMNHLFEACFAGTDLVRLCFGQTVWLQGEGY
jgi:hypothetical protein